MTSTSAHRRRELILYSVTADAGGLMSSITARLPRELILASAGSGKTFRISSRIIGLLAAGEPPATIFASTFTRKAAGEILDRVLVRLARAALDPHEARELARHAALDEASPLPGDRDFWRGVLQRTMRQLHRVDIGTLDAFFVRAVGSFGHDLGLPPRWGIADEPEAERIRSDALQDVLSAADGGARVELVRGLAAGAARRSVHDDLAGRVDGILDIHHALDADGPGWNAIQAVTGERPADFADRCRDLAERLSAAKVPRTKAGAPDARWTSARDQAAEAVREAAWGALIGGRLFCAAIDDPDEGRFQGKPIPPEIAAHMREAAVLARYDLATDYAARAGAMARLAELYSAAFDARLRETGALRFGDLTRLLAGPTPLGARPDLLYRLDAGTRHILLDEFQDTSRAQWSALEPLTDLLLHAETFGAAVVVADPKQSVYGWRGAAPVVVRHVGERYSLENEVLARSWRSSQVVLDAVNAIFDGIPNREAFDGRESDRAVAAAWAEAFTPHVPAKELPGHVRLVAGPRDEGRGAQKPLLCRWAAERIRELHAAAPGRGIGVLTRTNATVARLMFELRELGVPASEEGGTPLTDSAAVASVLALLHLADHPGDALSAYHVARTPVGAVVGLENPADRRATAATAHRTRKLLLDHGYGHTLARLAARLEEACDARERARLHQLVELGFRYDDRPTLRTSDFVRHVLAERVEVPSRADVRVMTVHQSKGLEFDIVVLPELEAPLTRGPDASKPLAYRPTAAGRVTHVFPYMPDHHRRVFGDVPELMAAYDQARGAGTRDALSTLYVAVTRARHAVHMFVAADGRKRPGTPRTYARLVRDALAGVPTPDDPAGEGDVLFESGDPDWHRAAGAAIRTGGPVATPAPASIALRGPDRRNRMLPRRTPSQLEGGRTVDVPFLLGLQGSDTSRARGSIVHAWLERLRWIEEGLPESDELLGIARRVAPAMDEAEAARLVRWLRDRLAAPAIRDALSRDRFDAGVEVDVETELPFIRREGDHLIEGVIDRLALAVQNGVVVGAEVLDYKTDTLDPGDGAALDARTRHYAPQLAAYRRAVAEMYGLDDDVVAARLVFLAIETVRDPAGT